MLDWTLDWLDWPPPKDKGGRLVVLLQALDALDDLAGVMAEGGPKKQCHRLELYGDGSGALYGTDGEEIMDFPDLQGAALVLIEEALKYRPAARNLIAGVVG